MRLLFVLSFLLCLNSCSWFKQPDRLVLKPVQFADIAGWQTDNHGEALGAFLKSCEAFAQKSNKDETGKGELLASASVWKAVCRSAQLVPVGDTPAARVFFEEAFLPFRATNNGNATGLFTGYYEPLLLGSHVQKEPFVYPVYAAPPSGMNIYSRAQIDSGALIGQVPVIAYTDDPVMLYFLHVQGSGRIKLENGEIIRVGYAGANGQKYKSIGKVLVDRDIFKKEDVTMPLLRQWLAEHPQEKWQLMWENPSYVFFREMQGDAIGSQKVPLTAGRSLAVDARFIPLGMPVFLDTVLPETPLSPPVIHRHLMVAQDTGGAIRGPVRADIFFGFGPMAEQLAGHMRAGGEVTLLVPRELVLGWVKSH